MAKDLGKPGGQDTHILSVTLGENGSLLLETLLLSSILLAMAGCIMALRFSAASGQAAEARLQAVYLAEAQLERVRARAEATGLSPGELPWLGREDSLQKGKGYRVKTLVGDRSETGMYMVQVCAAYQAQGDWKEVGFEREVRGKAADAGAAH